MISDEICQKSRSYGRLSMDDDVCADAASTLGSVKERRLDRVCAVSTLESVKMYSVASCIQTCQPTVYSQLLAHYTIDCRPIKRSRSELSLYFSESSTFYVQSDQ